MTTTTILLGNLRLENCGESIPGELLIVQHPSGYDTHMSPAEWQSLLAVAAVVTAAKEWRNSADTEDAAQRWGAAHALDIALQQLDTLTAGGEK